MSTTPLFDALARRTGSGSRTESRIPSATAPDRLPTSPMTAPVPRSRSTLVPADLIAAIEGIPTDALASVQRDHRVDGDQFALVEAVADAITRAVVDAVVTELDRITAAGVVRV